MEGRHLFLVLVSRKNFSDDWTVVRGPKREHKVKSAGVRILGENQEGMSVKLYVKYIPNIRGRHSPKKTCSNLIYFHARWSSDSSRKKKQSVP